MSKYIVAARLPLLSFSYLFAAGAACPGSPRLRRPATGRADAEHVAGSFAVGAQLEKTKSRLTRS